LIGFRIGWCWKKCEGPTFQKCTLTLACKGAENSSFQGDTVDGSEMSGGEPDF